MVTLDASEIQIDDPDIALVKIPAVDWPTGARMSAMWIDPATVSQWGKTASQLYLSIGTTDHGGAFAYLVPLSTPAPTLRGHEGPRLGVSSAGELDGDLLLGVSSDNLPLKGSVGHLDLHVVVATPDQF